MDETDNSTGPPEAASREGGVLAALPRTRPQRASPRRAAARDKASQSEKSASARKPKTARAEKGPRAKPSPTKIAEPPAPKQGYEPEDDVELGKSVNPPSGVELVESVAEIVGELANSGLAAGGRLLKDAFSLLRRP